MGISWERSHNSLVKSPCSRAFAWNALPASAGGRGEPGGDRAPRRCLALQFIVDDPEEVRRRLSLGPSARIEDPEGNGILLREPDVTAATRLNDVILDTPETMAVLEGHGIRVCGGCLVLLNSALADVGAYSGLSPAETAEMVEQLKQMRSHSEREDG